MTPSAPAIADGPAIALDALAQLVTTVAEDFPAAGLQPGPADVQETLDELLPGADAGVYVVPAGSGLPRDVFVIVASSLLTTMGAASIDAMPGVVERVINELVGDGDIPDLAAARLGAGLDTVDGLSVSSDGPGAVMVAAGLFAGADHVATVGVAVRPVAPIDAADPVAAEPDASVGPTGGLV
ncbi:MAG: hypothetical protein JJE52_18765, partial [Acidimicrobiia bacterium]|nr:hypothetical protein [Acidimicrobiia bacterium]